MLTETPFQKLIINKNTFKTKNKISPTPYHNFFPNQSSQRSAYNSPLYAEAPIDVDQLRLEADARDVSNSAYFDDKNYDLLNEIINNGDIMQLGLKYMRDRSNQQGVEVSVFIRDISSKEDPLNLVKLYLDHFSGKESGNTKTSSYFLYNRGSLDVEFVGSIHNHPNNSVPSLADIKYLARASNDSDNIFNIQISIVDSPNFTVIMSVQDPSQLAELVKNTSIKKNMVSRIFKNQKKYGKNRETVIKTLKYYNVLLKGSINFYISSPNNKQSYIKIGISS